MRDAVSMPCRIFQSSGRVFRHSDGVGLCIHPSPRLVISDLYFCNATNAPKHSLAYTACGKTVTVRHAHRPSQRHASQSVGLIKVYKEDESQLFDPHQAPQGAYLSANRYLRTTVRSDTLATSRHSTYTATEWSAIFLPLGLSRRKPEFFITSTMANSSSPLLYLSSPSLVSRSECKALA